MSSYQIRVRVLNAAEGTPVSYAFVALLPRVVAPAPSLPLPIKLNLLDEGEGLYGAEVASGDYTLQVQADALAAERRAVRVGSSPVSETVLLGRLGQQGYYRGRVRVPFDHDPELIGVALPPGAELAPILEAALALGWEREADARLESGGILLLRRARADGAEARALADTFRERLGLAQLGPVVRSGRGASILTARLAVRFTADLTREQITAIARELDLIPLRALAWAPSAFVFALARPTLDLSALERCRLLRERWDVVYAEPLMVHALEDHAITPTEALFALQWTHTLVGLPEAWQALRALNPTGVNPGDPGDLSYGSAQRVVAILDTNGVETDTAGTPVHPDLGGTVSDGSSKAVGFFDFVTWVAHNGTAGLSGHGTRCAGVAVGKADNLDGGAAFGVAGAAPNARYLGARVWVSSNAADALAAEELLADAIAWAAGLPTGNPSASFPAPLATPAEVLSLSFGFASPALYSSGHLSDALDAVTTYGRGGRGVIVVASAGNESRQIVDGEALCGHPSVITVAASSLVSETEEGTTNYTNYGTPVDLCAPSSIGSTVAAPPSRAFHVHSADRASEADGPGRVVRTTTLAADAPSGALTITVADATGIAVGDGLLIGDMASGNVDARRVISVSPPRIGIGTVATLTSPTSGGLSFAHASGDAVWVGPRACTATFGGTSAAAPLVAGTAALLLSARPTLTWVEVRDLLRSSATVIAPQDAGWSAGFNPRFGYGRLNAAAALNAAIAAGGADLLIRDNLQDLGDVPSPGWFAYSPDLWVRNADEAAPTLLYDQPPPHQSPIRGQDNRVWVRVKNRGGQPSSTAKARVLVAHFPGIEFIYPDDWTPDEPPSSAADPLLPGSYLIGEVALDPLLAGASTMLSMLWPSALVPPEKVTVNGVEVLWHPCLLAEITPQDGPIDTASGAIAVRRSNNLAQRNLSVVDGAGGGGAGVVAGSRQGAVEGLVLEWRGQVGAAGVLLQTPDPHRWEAWKDLIAEPPTPRPVAPGPAPAPHRPGCLTAVFRPSTWASAVGGLLGSPPSGATPVATPAAPRGASSPFAAATLAGRPALAWRPSERAELPFRVARGERALIVVALPGAKGELHVRQRLADGRVVGGYTVRAG